MTATRFDVVGIGNAVVDIIAHCTDELITELNLTKGRMQLIDRGEAERLYPFLQTPTEISGGSVANTMAGLSSFGGKAAFIGHVAEDPFGQIFESDIKSQGVTYHRAANCSASGTSRCLVLVSPDGERTMNTFLGSNTHVTPEDLDPEIIRSSKILYLEGYLFDRSETKEAFYKAAEIAAHAERKVALNLSALMCVEGHRDDFRNFIRSHVDLLIANEMEVQSLYETENLQEVAKGVASDCLLSAVTFGEKGSMIVTTSETISIEPVATKEVVDTTGAGDLYAAGFLFGYTSGFDLPKCGRLASLAGAEIVSHIGARAQQSLSSLPF